MTANHKSQKASPY